MDRTISLSETMVENLEKYTRYRHRRSIDDTIVELLHYALTIIPPYFAQFDWEQAEAEADEDIHTGRMQAFHSVENFLADLIQKTTTN